MGGLGQELDDIYELSYFGVRAGGGIGSGRENMTKNMTGVGGWVRPCMTKYDICRVGWVGGSRIPKTWMTSYLNGP